MFIKYLYRPKRIFVAQHLVHQEVGIVWIHYTNRQQWAMEKKEDKRGKKGEKRNRNTCSEKVTRGKERCKWNDELTI